MSNERPPRVTRRRALGIAFAGAAFASAGSVVAIVGSFLKPREPREFGAAFTAGNARDYPRGADPVRPTTIGFWLANLDPSDTGKNGSGGGVGLLACREKCPHRGSTVEWTKDHSFDGTEGWYYCRAHGATFTRAGVRVAGPSPRGMDTIRISVDDFGTITVDTGKVSAGGADNPSRALDHPFLPR